MRKTILAIALSLGACTSSADRAAYLNTLVGQPEAELVRQLGVPSRMLETGGHKFLAYDQQRSTTIYAGGPYFGSIGGYYGGGFGGYYSTIPTEVVSRQCATTFELVDDRVISWFLRGDGCG
jgi:hypothetical protein